jgi:hypothetical protein
VIVASVEWRSRGGRQPSPATKHTDPCKGHSMSTDLSSILADPVQRKWAEKKLFARVRWSRETGCWEWYGAKNGVGYGQIRGYGERGWRGLAHRVSYVLHCRPIGREELVCHKCDNPCCVNPVHLFSGSSSDNVQDMMRKGRHKPRRGESSPFARLTEADVVEIRKLYAEGVDTGSLSRRYGIHNETAAAVVSGKKWKHVPGAVPIRKPIDRAKPTTVARPDQIIEVHRLRGEGKTGPEIADAVGLNVNTVYYHLKRPGRREYRPC